MTTSDIDIYGVSAVTGTALSSNTLSCPFWNGGQMDNTGYDMFPIREITSERSTATKQIVLIYPNPTDKMLYVQNNSKQIGNCTVKLVDMTGRIIYLRPSSINSNTQSFDVSTLAAGLYQVIIEQNGVILAKQKLVVRR